ncbi:inositol monophosphatase family protein [Streptomyces polychromogenes]|uniref:Inositol monophosphatase family protein n=1 Tax=Streptomyces polychromogenes TaxID=67342 RepID=A0ABN0VIN6_9ACTN
MSEAENVRRVLLEAADRYLRSPDRTAEIKGVRDLVTETDRAIGRFLADRLTTVRGDAPVYAEDLPVGALHRAASSPMLADGPRWRWRLDPVDGTVNFARGLPWYSVCVTLEQEDRAELAVVLDAEHGRLVTAVAGGGAVRHTVTPGGFAADTGLAEPVHTVSRPVDASLVSVMLTPKMSKGARAATLRLIDHLLDHTQGVRIVVSQALEAVMLAQGQLDAVVSLESSGGWTRSAAMLFACEAGGRVTELHDISGGRTGFLLSAGEEFTRWLGEWCVSHGITPVARVEG